MVFEERKIEKIVPYDKNPRDNSKAVDRVLESLKIHGQVKPIVLSAEGHPFNNEIVCAGHTTLQALKKFGAKEVKVIVKQFKDEAEFVDYNIRDNKTGEFAEWDEQSLADLSAEFELDLNDMGFEFELKPEDVEGMTDEDEIPEVPEEPTSEFGQIWKLGEHRLMCGDSTNQDQYAKLMGDSQLDMVFTDPPYNIDYKGLNDKHEKIKNDKMSDEDFVSFLQASVPSADIMYVCHSWQYSHLFRKALENNGVKLKALIVWDKVNPAQNLDLYYKQHELIWYTGPFGGQKTVRGDVLEAKREKNTVHPTMKPVGLIVTALKDQEAKTVYDPFGGSGSTLIACEKTRRKCRMMELDPKYCDVIRKRWEEFTGKESELCDAV